MTNQKKILLNLIENYPVSLQNEWGENIIPSSLILKFLIMFVNVRKSLMKHNLISYPVGSCGSYSGDYTAGA
jgi:hypothetical protein